MTEESDMSIDAPETPEPRKTGHRNLDLVISACALFMSAVSIYMAYHTGISMERLVHANSWPFLQIESGNTGPNPGTDGDEIYFSVKNAGTGPARLHSLEFLLDGRPMRESFALDQIALNCCRTARDAVVGAAGEHPLDAFGTVNTAPIAPGFLAPGDDVTFLSWRKTPANAALWEAIDQARYTRRIAVRACFCSVFDECWIAQTNQFPPRPVHECVQPPAAGGH